MRRGEMVFETGHDQVASRRMFQEVSAKSIARIMGARTRPQREMH